MPETDTFLPNGLSSKGLTVLDKDGSIVELPPQIELNDLNIVKKEPNNGTSLPRGMASTGFTLIDNAGNEYLIIDTIQLGANNIDNLANPPLESTSAILTGLFDRVGNDIKEYADDDYELADINTVLMEEVEKDKFREGDKVSDVSYDKYSFDGNNVYATGDAGVEIDGFLFFPEEVQGDESYARREYTRTKIMSGGEFVTRGQYTPKEFSFSTTLDIDPNQPYMYDKIFQIMENKPCEVVSPYMGDIFKAEIEIDKTHPKASPGSLKLDIKIKEIVDPTTTVVGDTPIKYPSTTTLSSDAINVKRISKYSPQEKEDKEANENAKIKADSKKYYGDGREVTEDSDALSNKNVNQWHKDNSK